MAYAYAVCTWHVHMPYAYAFLGSLRGEAPHKLQEGVWGGRERPGVEVLGIGSLGESFWGSKI